MRLTTADRARAVILSAGITEKSRVNIVLLGGLIESAIQDAVREATERAEGGLEEARAAFNRWPASPGDSPFDGQPCPICPWQIRNLFACAHNLTVAEYGSERFLRKLADLRRAVELVQPLADAHFADPKHAHMAAATENTDGR